LSRFLVSPWQHDKRAGTLKKMRNRLVRPCPPSSEREIAPQRAALRAPGGHVASGGDGSTRTGPGAAGGGSGHHFQLVTGAKRKHALGQSRCVDQFLKIHPMCDKVRNGGLDRDTGMNRLSYFCSHAARSIRRGFPSHPLRGAGFRGTALRRELYRCATSARSRQDRMLFPGLRPPDRLGDSA